MMKSYLLLALPFLLLACQPSPPANEATTTPETATPPEVEVPAADRFEAEIVAFEQADRQGDTLRSGVLFTGSSSIRMWKSLREDMTGFRVLNRGFGGATIPEVLRYSDRYLFVHQPQVIVFYCGENDIAAGASPEQVYGRFKVFAELVAERLPDTKLLYLSMNPSPERWAMWDQFQRGDQLIRAYINDYPQIDYLSTAKTMLDEEGSVKADIFIEDGLHLNAKGYAAWTAQIRPLLTKYLE